jgi:hypothetical protein
MKTLKFSTYILFSFLFIATSCKKEGCTDEKALNYNADAKKDDGSCSYPSAENALKLKFDHKWGNTWADFSMNQNLTHPGTGETMNFQILNYYISGVKLKKEDGSWWEENESYHLIKVDENNTAPHIHINVPSGNYTAVSYRIGVDSTRNVSGAQTGALSPSNGMFWSWNTGYIFIKAEGLSEDAPNGNFKYHIGGFQGEHNAIRYNEHSFSGQNLVIDSEGHPSIHFFVNAARFWHGGLSLEDNHTIHMPGQKASNIADNFKDAFIVDHIH